MDACRDCYFPFSKTNYLKHDEICCLAYRNYYFSIKIKNMFFFFFGPGFTYVSLRLIVLHKDCINICKNINFNMFVKCFHWGLFISITWDTGTWDLSYYWVLNEVGEALGNTVTQNYLMWLYPKAMHALLHLLTKLSHEYAKCSM